jgi:hypothetical protein
MSASNAHKVDFRFSTADKEPYRAQASLSSGWHSWHTKTGHWPVAAGIDSRFRSLDRLEALRGLLARQARGLSSCVSPR